MWQEWSNVNWGCGVSGRREKLQACEGKLRAAIQDKNNVGLEKAALERELKGLRGHAGKLTKVCPVCVCVFVCTCVGIHA